MVNRQLQSHNFGEDQIMELKLNRQLMLVLICDGYDEIQQLVNLHKASVSTSLASVTPKWSSAAGVNTLNLHARIVSIRNPTIRTSWSTQGYMEKLITIPNLMVLVKDPFLILLALEAISDAIYGNQGLSTISIVPIQLYNTFVNHWFNVSNRQLRSNTLVKEDCDVLEQLEGIRKGLRVK
ncbi:hypothetical protein KI688_005287 [Linnemannia hyalina]|uniref:Uncharacterized protein n=1 Tax=Linnemannia hyalina TaxID=64524 RepID=A0A9P7XK63_9FUNG|nr:hypothetical protein KI688_005287 [Linnemannia hyalina]